MAHTIPTDDLSPGQREWLREVWDRLPFSKNGTTYRTVDEVLQDFEMPEDERVTEQATADREWYREALAKYEAERADWEESYDEDPASEAEQKFAQDLYTAGFLGEIKLSRPINPAALGLGSREYETVSTLPPGWLIREALARRSAEMFGDDQSTTESAGCSLTVGAVQGGGKIAHLFYDGVVNSVFGDRSAGKTWLALFLVREFIERGEHVIWLNFEGMTGSNLRARLTAMGVEEAKISAYFHVYDRADEAPSHTLRVGLVVIDAVDPCLGHNDWNVNDPSSVDKMAKRYFYPYQATNPSVTGLTIDHVGNTEKTRESGSRRKQHYTQGVKYQMASWEKSRKGTKGYSALLLRKDNNGEVPFDDGEEVAYVVLDSTRDAERIDVLITAHAPLKANESVTEQTQRKSARTDGLALIRDQGPITRGEYLAHMTELGYTSANARKAIGRLKSDHLIEVEGEESQHLLSMVTTD